MPTTPAPQTRLADVVLKFGSSALDPQTRLADVIQEVYREVREGRRVVAVVSAFAGVTDRLLQEATQAYGTPDPAALALLLSTGETAAAAQLGLALEQAGVPAQVADPARVGLECRGSLLDAEPCALDVAAFEPLFEKAPVVVLPGFFARAEDGTIALLGRGGSDLTALFVAHRLGAECRLLKDVEALHPFDPRVGHPAACVYRSATWDEALRVGGKLVQPKALRFAKEHGVRFTLSRPLGSFRTEIGPGPTVLVPRPEAAPPVRVALLGLGTVGQGVYARLAAHPAAFNVVGVAVRDLAKRRDVRVPDGLLVDDARALLDRPADVVVELIGGREPALCFIREALSRGRHVVTANKDVYSRHGAELDALAAANGARIACSASVGGAVPVLERANGPLSRIEGVLNGTCNFVLDRLAEGADLRGAVAQAQELGFAEADPRLDLSGADAAHKIAILARTAFGEEVHPDQVACTGIEGLDPARVREAASRGEAIKLVASCTRNGRGVHASVSPVALDARHPLAGARNEENRVLLHGTDGASVLLRGKGAGRWPTTLSVVADLFDLLLSGDRSAPCADGALVLEA